MVDFAAEGLLDGLDGDARAARERLLRELSGEGVGLDELKRACEEDRLALLPVDRALQAEARYTPRDVSEHSGLPPEQLRATRAAFGLPTYDDDERALSEADMSLSGRGLKTLLDAGVPLDGILELNRIIGRAMHQVAAASRALVAEALFQPDLDEYEVATRAATAARELTPLMAPVLEYVYEGHLRQILREDVMSAADIAAGRAASARDMTVAFADLVGFTRLGEEVPAEELGAVARRLEELAGERVRAPVTFVKTVGDAVMLVAADADRLIETALDILDAAAAAEGRAFPQLRVGVARGPALERAGDWFGSPVNTASRVTGVARAGSVLATADVKREASEEWAWSFAGERKLRGVGVKRLFRARRPKAGSA